ncbi:hypothetical protein [uncultured Methanobrevibacter sp.]|uniref:hypothetical protein n=1 Tax=uncultured Methanobrevibacter sp. TaxID=253161 RepID=UPI003208602B
MKKEILIFLLAICVLFTLSSVCAGDVNDTAIASENTNQVIEETNIDDTLASGEDEVIVQTDNDEILSEKDDGTFAALQQKIDDAEEGEVITLENDYSYDSSYPSTGIVITKSITINGNNHIIDGKEESRIFECYGGNVVLNNINFHNGKNNKEGGAIYSESNLKINDCNFIHNDVSYGTYAGFHGIGGAIYSTKNLELNNCYFERNFASAMYHEGYGGAIYSKGNVILNYCSFKKNIAAKNLQRGGKGIIYCEAAIKLNYCEFTENIAAGGEVIGTPYDIKKCKFDGVLVSKSSSSPDQKNPDKQPKKTIKTTLTLKKVKVKKSAKKLVITATLKINKKAAKSKVIKFKFNKKTYKAKTNKKGVAKIAINKKILKKLKIGKKVAYSATYGKITKKITVKVKK